MRLIALALLASGCMATHPTGSARTLPAGELQHQVSLTVVGQAQSLTNRTPDLPFMMPLPRYALRYGLADGVELGGQASFAGGGGDLKLGILRSDGFALALAPQVSLLYTSFEDPGLLAQGQLPLLVELDLSRWLALRPSASVGFAARTSRYVGVPTAGGSLGLGLRLGDDYVLEPSVGVLVDLDNAFPFYGASLALQIGG